MTPEIRTRHTYDHQLSRFIHSTGDIQLAIGPSVILCWKLDRKTLVGYGNIHRHGFYLVKSGRRISPPRIIGVGIKAAALERDK